MVGRAHVQQLERTHAQRRSLRGAGAVELRDELLEREVERARVAQHAVRDLRR